MNIKPLALSLATLLASCSTNSLEIYVSPDGCVTNSGTIDSPFGSMAEAQSYIRTLPSSERNSDIRVIFRGGEYALDSTVKFTLEDSAPDGYTYSYEAFEGETPIFNSNYQLTEWDKADAKSLPKELSADVADNIWVASYPSNYASPYLLFNGENTIYRSKMEGFDVVPFTPLSLEQHKEKCSTSEYNASRSMNVYYDEDRYLLKQFDVKDPDKVLRNWSVEDEVEVAFAPVPWVLNTLPIERVDLKKGVVYTTLEANAPAGSKPSHTKPHVENAMEYITPGTFVARGGKIYYCKSGNERLEKFSMPTLCEYILIEGDIDYMGEDTPVKNLQFKGLHFANANRYTWNEDHKGWGIQHDWDKFDAPNAMFRFRGAEGCTIDGCRFYNSANSAIRLDLYCQDVTVKNSVINYVGHMGILLCGYGPGTKDVNKGNRITNNVIHHVGQVVTHGAGVFMWQSGENEVSHNLIHHVPRKGVGICGVRMPILIKDWCDFDEASKTIRWSELNKGNFDKYKAGEITLGEYWIMCLPYLHARNNVVEYNEVYRALEYLGDGSVLNVSGAGEGNVVRNNYAHHVASHASGVLRTDDWQRGTTFSENIVYTTNIAAFVHKGYNHIVNNLVVDSSCKEYIRFASYPDEEADYGSDIKYNVFYESGEKCNFYRESYRASEGISLPHNCNTDFNLFCVAGRMADAEKHIEMWNKRGVEQSSVAVEPIFANGSKWPFELSAESPAYALGFKRIESEKIGLTDEFPESLWKYNVEDDDRKPNFHRQRSSKEALYDFW